MRYILISLLLFSFSCVSLKPAGDKDRAETRIKKYNKGIQNQIDKFPSLVDEAFTTTKTDSVLIPGDSIIIRDTLQDTAELDKLSTAFKDKAYELFETEAELSYIEALSDNDKKNLKNIQLRLRQSTKVLDSLFKRYKQASSLLNQVGVIEKETFNLKYKIINGKLSIKSELKDSYKIINKNTTTNNITIKDKFYQDPKFWIGLVIVLTLLYFVGDKIVELWKNFIDSIISFIKRLIFKL